jgi:hypothetical protein
VLATAVRSSSILQITHGMSPGWQQILSLVMKLVLDLPRSELGFKPNWLAASWQLLVRVW